MTVDLQEKNETTRLLKVRIPEEEVERTFTQVTARVKEHAALPGFRKGKVPLELVHQKFGREIHEEVLERLFSESYQQALIETRCVPIERPKVDKLELNRNQPLQYEVSIQVLPKVKLGNYQGLKLKVPALKVAESEVAQALEGLRERHAALEPVEDRASQPGDVVTIDFAGTRDGQPVKGAEATNYPVELGSGMTIPDFEQNLTGLKLHESRTFTAHFPKDYHAPDLAGQEVEFTVMLKGLRKKVLPELTDDLAKQIGPFSSLEELRQRLRENLNTEKARQRKLLLRDQIIDALDHLAQVKVPEVLVKRSLDSMVRDQERRMERQQQTWEQRQLTPAAFQEQNRASVEYELKAQLALREIATLEHLTVADEDVTREVEALARSSGQPAENVRRALTKSEQWEDLKDRILEDKTVDFIIAHAKVSET